MAVGRDLSSEHVISQKRFTQFLCIQFPTSRMRRHHRLRLGRNRILPPPQTRHSLPLRIKIQPRLPIKIIRPTTSNTLLIPCEAEHRQGHGDRDVDAQLADIHVLLELGGGGAGAGEDGGAVAVGVGVYEVDGGVDGVDVEADEDGAEDLFGVAFHVRLDVGYYGWTDLEDAR
jgi:hypothetical protein